MRTFNRECGLLEYAAATFPRALLRVCLLLGCLGNARPLYAQSDLSDSVSVSFALSGAISNGSYQAGVLSAIVAFMRASNDNLLGPEFSAPRFRVLGTTGASAGSINSLAVPAMFCATGERSKITESLLWEIWVPVGLSQLFSKRGGPDSAIFSRRYFESKQLPKVQKALEATSCRDSLFVGLTVTRDSAILERVGAVEVPLQRMVTAFELTQSGMRHSTRLKIGHSEVGATIRIRGQAVDAAMQGVLASSAFPVAFAPVTLDYWYDSTKVTDSSATIKARFLDGGVFENEPLSLLRSLTARDPSIQNNRQWVVAITPGIRPEGFAASFGSSDARTYTRKKPNPALRLFSSLVPTGRAYEKSMLLRLDTDRDWLQSVHPTVRQTASFGSTLGSFGAFLSRSFREYDFLTGVADGLRYAARHWTCASDSLRMKGECHTATVPSLAVAMVDSVAIKLVESLPEIRRDSVAREVVGTLLAKTERLPSKDSSVRMRTLNLYVKHARVLDSVAVLAEADKLPPSACMSNAQSGLCTSGLWHVFRMLRDTLKWSINNAAIACSWDVDSLDYGKNCRDAGFFESNPRPLFRPRPKPFLDAGSLIADPVFAFDRLVTDGVAKAYSSTPELAYRAAWLAFRNVSPPHVASVNPTTTLNSGAAARYIVPFRASVLSPLGSGAASTTLRTTQWIWESRSGWVGAQFMVLGYDVVFPHERGAKAYGAPFIAASFSPRKGGIGLEIGPHFSLREQGGKRLASAYANLTFLGVVTVGVEYPLGRHDKSTNGGRLSAGLNDLRGLFWLVSGK